jgi:hypothetical protein
MSTRVICYNTDCKHNYKAWCCCDKIEISAEKAPVCVTYLESKINDTPPELTSHLMQ